jgi:hypothetical protein
LSFFELVDFFLLSKDGIDLFLGNYCVSSDKGRTPESCPISKEISKNFLLLPVTMFLAFSIFARFDMCLEVDAKRFAEKLKTCQHHVDYFIINSTHGTIASKFAKNDAQKYFFIFIRQHIKY